MENLSARDIEDLQQKIKETVVQEKSLEELSKPHISNPSKPVVNSLSAPDIEDLQQKIKETVVEEKSLEELSKLTKPIDSFMDFLHKILPDTVKFTEKDITITEVWFDWKLKEETKNKLTENCEKTRKFTIDAQVTDSTKGKNFEFLTSFENEKFMGPFAKDI